MPKNRAMLALTKKFFETNPVDATKSLEQLEPAEAVRVLSLMGPDTAAAVFNYLPTDHAAELIKSIPAELLEKIAPRIEPQHAASILLVLPEDAGENLVEKMPEKSRQQVRDLLTFPENSAGRIMSTRYISLREDVKVREAVQKIRMLARRKAPSSYVYVVDTEKKLTGVINMRDMMLASGSSELKSVMKRDVFTVSPFADREDVANMLGRKKYFAAPVVDPQGRMLGIIRAESLIDDVREEGAEDIQKIFGAGGDEKPFSPVSFSLKQRLPWLHINLGTAFMAAFVVSMFEGLIAKITMLAVFLPVVAGQGGNAGAQSLAVVMRGLVMREIHPGKARGLIIKEAFLGLIGGVITGTITGLIAWVWYKNYFLGIVVGIAMIANLFIAGFAGAAIPITMKKMGFDPAQSSNIILTTVTDVFGFFVFLGLALIFKDYLIL